MLALLCSPLFLTDVGVQISGFAVRIRMWHSDEYSQTSLDWSTVETKAVNHQTPISE